MPTRITNANADFKYFPSFVFVVGSDSAIVGNGKFFKKKK